jgi:hypothetical protein
MNLFKFKEKEIKKELEEMYSNEPLKDEIVDVFMSQAEMFINDIAGIHTADNSYLCKDCFDPKLIDDNKNSFVKYSEIEIAGALVCEKCGKID